MKLQSNMQQHPEDKTSYEIGIRKYGKKVFEAIEHYVPPNIVCSNISLPSFVVTASCENSAISVIYYLLRNKNLDLTSLVSYQEVTR
jgi:hypothetical protein